MPQWALPTGTVAVLWFGLHHQNGQVTCTLLGCHNEGIDDVNLRLCVADLHDVNHF